MARLDRTATSRAALAAALALGAAGCGPADDATPFEPVREAELPLAAYCTATVQGVGDLDVENDYLPHVIQCENGGAGPESLRAQAVAARSYLYYKLETSGSVKDGTGDQVYSCGATPGPEHVQAVKDTSGVFLSYAGVTVCAFFVAGAKQSPPACAGNQSDPTNTEKFVTYNDGLSGDAIHQTTLGWVSPSNHRNRGCFSQWGSRCLETAGRDWQGMLHFYYGADIGIEQATGPCVVQPDAPPAGSLDEASCDVVRGWAQDPDVPAAPTDVRVTFDGAAGDAGVKERDVHADADRADLCGPLGSCNHAFSLPLPRSLRDGAAHAVHAYGLDAQGGASAELGGSPKSVTCAPPAPPLDPESGVKRWVTGPAPFAAWKLDDLEVAHLADATVAAYPAGADLPPAPEVVQADDGTPEVWVIDGAARRHVASPASLAAWKLDGMVAKKPAADVYSHAKGPDWRDAPFVFRGGDPKVYVLDDAPVAVGAGGGGAGGGPSSAGGGAATATGAAGGPSAGDGVAHAGVTDPSSDAGCGCRGAIGDAPGSGSRSASLSLLPLAFALVVRRRRR
jgi:hypothetical protein